MRGWETAASSPEEAFRIVIKQLHEARIPASHMRQKHMLQEVTRLLPPFGKDAKPGKMASGEYSAAAALLSETGIIKQAPPYESFVSECAR